MWRDYSWGYIKNNRASGISVMVAAFISALLLSILCSLFYNLWVYEIEGIEIEEGDWQGRITGEIDAEDLALIQNYANVERAVINDELSDGQQIVVEVYFRNIRTILTDMSQIAKLLGLSSEAVAYHHKLLNMYLVRDPQDTAPRLIFPLFLVITAIACISLIMIIHNSFAVTMSGRIHQFGILSSIGATPAQIRSCLQQEAAALCVIPILTGSLLGILISMGIIEGMNVMLADVSGRLELSFAYHLLILLFSLFVAILTVWISAWIPARKLSRLTPLEAIKNTGELQLKRKKNSRILSFLFGIEGELAGNALKAQRKALRTAVLSLTFSFLAFTLMLCFFKLSQISTRMTYFERYQTSWDIMVTVKNTKIDEFGETDAMQSFSGVRSCVVYQKVSAKRVIAEDEISAKLHSIGGLQSGLADYVSDWNGAWLVNAPILVLDNAGFLEYCEQIGAPSVLDGAVIINSIQDVTDPNFRDRKMLPYLKGTGETTVLHQAGQEEITAEIPVIAYAKQLPVLKEAYGDVDYYELVHIIPLSVWEEIKGQIGEAQDDTFIRILAAEGVTLTELNELQEKTARLLEGKYELEMENRIQDKLNNDAMIDGMMMIFGAFCVLLAVIGIGNVFSNTLGFVRQRKREFARYMSVGLTTAGIKKMFCVEALVLAGRPILITLPVTVADVGYMLKLSYLEPIVFLREAPIIPTLVFVFAVFGFVGLAYYLGGRKLLRSNLVDSLRNDIMM